MTIGNRVLIIGVSAVGKSTFARQFALKTGLPLIHMDAVMWQPGWSYIGDEETGKLLVTESKKDRWIIEGYITTAVRSELFEAADSIIYLDYPGWFAAWRYTKRWWQHRIHPRAELPGSPETFSWKFFMLVWKKGEAVKLDNLLATGTWDAKIIRLSSPKQAAKFLDTL